MNDQQRQEQADRAGRTIATWPDFLILGVVPPREAPAGTRRAFLEDVIATRETMGLDVSGLKPHLARI